MNVDNKHIFDCVVWLSGRSLCKLIGPFSRDVTVYKSHLWCKCSAQEVCMVPKVVDISWGESVLQVSEPCSVQNQLLKIVSVVGYALCRVPVNSMAGNMMKYSYTTFVYKFNLQENNYNMLWQVQDFSQVSNKYLSSNLSLSVSEPLQMFYL